MNILFKNSIISSISIIGLIFILPNEAYANWDTSYIDFKGASCRGRNWNNNDWPFAQGRVTLRECVRRCDSISSCTAFEYARPTWNSSGEEVGECYLYGHREVVPKKDEAARCFLRNK